MTPFLSQGKLSAFSPDVFRYFAIHFLDTSRPMSTACLCCENKGKQTGCVRIDMTAQGFYPERYRVAQEHHDRVAESQKSYIGYSPEFGLISESHHLHTTMYNIWCDIHWSVKFKHVEVWHLSVLWGRGVISIWDLGEDPSKFVGYGSRTPKKLWDLEANPPKFVVSGSRPSKSFGIWELTTPWYPPHFALLIAPKAVKLMRWPAKIIC